MLEPASVSLFLGGRKQKMGRRFGNVSWDLSGGGQRDFRRERKKATGHNGRIHERLPVNMLTTPTRRSSFWHGLPSDVPTAPLPALIIVLRRIHRSQACSSSYVSRFKFAHQQPVSGIIAAVVMVGPTQIKGQGYGVPTTKRFLSDD